MLLIIFVIANHSGGVTSLILFVTINQLARLFAIIVSQLIRALSLLASHIYCSTTIIQSYYDRRR